MIVEIEPEPTPEDRAALLEALAGLGGGDVASAWWAAGIREAVGDGAEESGGC